MASSVIISSPQNKDSFMAVTISLIPFVKLPEVFSSLMTSPVILGKGLALGLVSTFFTFVSYTLGLRQM